MNCSKKLLLTVFVLISILFSGASVLFAEDEAERYLSSRVISKRLSNGITLLMVNRGYSPVLYLEIAFKAGSADESYRTIGAAHVLEHMLFKGTDTLGTKDFAKEKPILQRIEAIGETLDVLRLRNPSNLRIPELERELKELQEEHQKLIVPSPYDTLYTEAGGVGFNASTSKDMTNYYISLPADRLELWAKTETERLRNPIMREFYQERNNIRQERMMRTDSIGSGLLFETFLAQAFSAHPYRHPVIGWETGIPYLSVKDIREFYYSKYIPSKMVITIVGMQDTDKTAQIVEKYFSRIPASPEPPAVNVAEPKQRGEKRFEISFASNPSLLIGWHKPAYPSKADYVFDVLAEVLAGSKSSMLYKSLVLEKKKAYSVSAWNGMPGAGYDNLFVISAAPARGVSCEALEAYIYEELDRALASVTEKDLQTVKIRLEADSLRDLTTNSGLGRILSYCQTVFGDWRYIADYRKETNKVTPENLRQAAAKYCIKSNRTVGFLKDSRTENKVEDDGNEK